MKQSTLIPISTGVSLSTAPQKPNLSTLFPSRSSRALKERAATEFQRNSYAAALTGAALQYTGALCALEAQLYAQHPYSGEFCRTLLGAYVYTSAQQILRFGE